MLKNKTENSTKHSTIWSSPYKDDSVAVQAELSKIFLSESYFFADPIVLCQK